MRSPTRPLLVAAAALALAAGAAFAAAPRAADDALLASVMQLVRDRFAMDTLSPDAIAEHAARGLVRELGDPYSELLSPRDLGDFNRTSLGRYGGVGMEVLAAGDSTYVGRVMPRSPSAAAGVRRGDRIVAVDGAPMDGLPSDSVVSRLRGAPGSEVRVTLAAADGRRVTHALRRVTVQVPAVPYSLVDDGVAYLPVENFGQSAAADVAEALDDALRQGARAAVLDLRGNPGGSLPQAVDMAGLFLPRGSDAVEIRERTGRLAVPTERAPLAPRLPLAVLVDGRTASAAEIVAGALQDHDRAVLVGERSFGKGLAQTLFPLDGGWALKLTTARWYTPRGRSIHRDRTARDSVFRRHVAAAPPVRSTHGRLLAGGGGIEPDVRVSPDTLRGAERGLAIALAQHAPAVRRALARVAVRLAAAHPDSTAPAPRAWSDALRAALRRDGVAIPDALWRDGAPYVERLMEAQVAELAWGAAAARRRTLGEDRAYQRAAALVRDPRTMAALLAGAESRRAS